MSRQTRAFGLSLLLHAAIIALVFIGSSLMGQYKKPAVLDFDLYKPAPAGKVVDLAPAGAQSIDPAARARTRQNEPARQPKEITPKPPVPESPPVVAPPEAPPAVKLPEAPSIDSSPVGQEMPDEGKAVQEASPKVAEAGSNTGTGGGAESRGSPGARYINENYAYIRDRILRNLRYPDEARRRGRQGRVVLSFIVTADGSVKALKVVQGSGHKTLDRGAIETVRGAGPFPRPPEEAQIVIPITYRLE